MAYTDCQGIISKWIRNGHELMREDSVLRCYACNGQDSHWYSFVEDFSPYGGEDMGDGWVHLNGSGIVGDDYVDSKGKLWKGKLHDYDVKSSHCGLQIHITNATLHGKSIAWLVTNGAEGSKASGDF